MYLLFKYICFFLGEELRTAFLEYKNKNNVRTQEICKELLFQNPTDLHILILISASNLCCHEYDLMINYLKRAHQINPNCLESLTVNQPRELYHLIKTEFIEVFRVLTGTIMHNISFVESWIYCIRMLYTSNFKIFDAFTTVLNSKPI